MASVSAPEPRPARHLIELHGGTIEAHSEGAGTGALFIVRLPIAARATTRISPEAVEA